MELVADRDRLELEYRNRGYENVIVTPAAEFAEGDREVDLSLAVNEGQQVFVDHVIITGNRRTSSKIIERELTVRAGDRKSVV